MDYKERKQKLQDDIVKLKEKIKEYRDWINKATTRISNLQGAYAMLEEIEQEEDKEDGE